MMTETVLLSDVVDQKDAALKQATRQLEKFQAENIMLKKKKWTATASSVNDDDDDVPTVPAMENEFQFDNETSAEFLYEKLRDAQQMLVAKKLTIASLQAELEVEKLRREELEQIANENRNDDSSSSTSVSISDVDSEAAEQITNSFALKCAAVASTTTPQSPPAAKNNEAKEEESDEDSSSIGGGEPGIRVFGQEQKLDAELEQEAALEIIIPNETIATADDDDDEGIETSADLSSSISKNKTIAVMEVAQEISELKHSILKRDECIDGLRAKLQEHEALISLLNKTLSGKDTKIDRLERLIGQTHHNVKISKELEENELTIDSLVLYRFEKEHQMTEIQDKIRELEDQVRASKETEYQLRRRTDELSGAEAKIRRLKAELKSESQHMAQLLEDNREKLGHAKEEKIKLEYAVQAQSQEMKGKLREKDDFIKSIHAEATERGLMIDSLEASLKETNKQLQRTESKVHQQAKELTLVRSKLGQLNEEKTQWIEEQQDKDELIQMLNDSRLEGQRIVAELTKPKPETNRQKVLRRYHKLQATEDGNRISGLQAYMEPFVLDIHQAQEQYEKARKNLRLAEARERLIRPRE
mmetsp:Transcript_13101/g.31015  ORF Transcript_13101/g.31015 Transcript_13101/m.31015 type:complete len:589 (+) Transcript_13101:986-2752(+)